MNRNFGKLNGEGQMEYAPDALRVGGMAVFNPREEDYRAAGYLRVTSAAPSKPAPEGRHYEPRGWDISDDPRQIRRAWELVDDPPPPPRVFSKLKVVTALAQEGVWPQVKAWIEEAGLYDLYLAAQDFAEDNEYFTSGRAALAAALDWSDEQVEALLSECVAED